MSQIGVLALQGDFAEHHQILRCMSVESIDVRLPEELAKVDALIIPGGESTTIALLLNLYHLTKPLEERVQSGMPIWGTCAGMIVMAKELTEDRPTPLGLVDISVTRNAFGSQVNSFEQDIVVPDLGSEAFRAVFIRAPVIREVGRDVTVMARLPDGTPVAARQGCALVTAFHPELTNDSRFHQYFLNWIP